MYNFWDKVTNMDAKDWGNTALDAALYATAIPNPITTPISMITGKSVPDLFGYKPKSELGGYMQKGASMISAATPAVAKTALMAKKGIVTYDEGGEVNEEKINIEKGEIEVNPETLDVVRSFEDAPKHPKKGRNKDGDRFVAKGNAIIPANQSAEYIKGDEKTRRKILASLPKETEDGMADNGVNPPTADQYWTANGYAPIQYPNEYVQGKQSYIPLSSSVGDSSKGSGGQSAYINPAGLVMGGYQMYEANKGLNALSSTPLPSLTPYQQSPEMNKAYNRAEGMVGQGYTQQELAAQKQALASSDAARYQKAMSMAGGQNASAVQAAINSQDIGALNKQALADAQLRNHNIAYADNLARAKAGQQNIITQGQREMDRLLWNRRQMAEQALANAKSQGMQNIAGSVYFNPLAGIDSATKGASSLGSLAALA